MKEKVLVILLKDPVYAGRLMNRCNAGPYNMSAVCFSDTAAFEEYAASLLKMPDCILFDEDTYDPVAARKAVTAGCLRFEPPGSGGLSAYMSADEILSALLPKDHETSPVLSAPQSRITLCLSLFDDGSSAAKALELAEKAEGDVLMVGFSPFSGEYCTKTGECCKGAELSALLYALSAGMTKLERYITHLSNIDMICGISYIRDLDEFTSEGASKLIRLLEDSRYRYIIIDAGALRGFTPALIEACDTLNIVKSGNDAERPRLDEYIKQLDFAGLTCGEKLREAYG